MKVLQCNILELAPGQRDMTKGLNLAGRVFPVISNDFLVPQYSSTHIADML